MNRNLLVKLAASGFVLGLTTTGCSGLGAFSNAPTKALGNPSDASKSAAQAREALAKGKVSRAVSLAEAAVGASPRNGDYRALLGQAYLNSGRFASASAALSEAMELGVSDGATVISLALAQIGEGKPREAISLLEQNRESIPASDLGLALALAGDNEAAIYVLTEAARQPTASARTRQNLALTYALAGRWPEAKIIASQDLPLDKLDSRLAEWARMMEKPEAGFRVARLMGTSQQKDSGMPVRLALSNFGGTALAANGGGTELASLDPAPLERFAPPPPSVDTVVAAPVAPTPVEIPSATIMVPPPPAKAAPVKAPVIQAAAAPYRQAPGAAAAPAQPARALQQQQSAAAAKPSMQVRPFNAKKPSGWAVQLGAFDSLGIAKDKWAAAKGQSGQLAHFPVSSHAASVNGRTFYRLTVNGLASRVDAAALCNELQAKGQRCFIRQMDGGEQIKWATNPSPMQMAAR